MFDRIKFGELPDLGARHSASAIKAIPWHLTCQVYRGIVAMDKHSNGVLYLYVGMIEGGMLLAVLLWNVHGRL